LSTGGSSIQTGGTTASDASRISAALKRRRRKRKAKRYTSSGEGTGFSGSGTKPPGVAY
jgi:DNA-binding protein H-NS